MADVVRIGGQLARIRDELQREAIDLRNRADDLDADAKYIERGRKAMHEAVDDASRLRYPDTTGK